MRLYSFVAAAALLTASLAAHADTITNTFTFAPLAGYSAEAGTSFAQFNPALGTLNSVTLNFTGRAMFSGGGNFDTNDATYNVRLGDDGESADAFHFGNGASNISLRNYTYASNNFAFIGSGTVNTSVSVANNDGAVAAVFTTFDTETLTYNYTAAAVVPPVVVPPVAVTPEPSSLALLGTGLLGVAGVLRKRFAA